MVVGEVGRHDPAEIRIKCCFLHQGHANALDDAPMDLTTGGLFVDDAAGVIDAEEAVDADAPQLGIDPDLHELRAEGLEGEALGLTAVKRCSRLTRPTGL